MTQELTMADLIEAFNSQDFMVLNLIQILDVSLP